MKFFTLQCASVKKVSLVATLPSEVSVISLSKYLRGFSVVCVYRKLLHWLIKDFVSYRNEWETGILSEADSLIDSTSSDHEVC